MLSRSAFSTFVLSFALVALAEVGPTEPSPGAVFQPGGSCTIGWTPDQTGTWKTLNIELMTGDNFNMVHLTTVGTVDGTASPGTFTYPCPAVTIPAPIYFYQFSTPADPTTLTWTGRFTIASSTGQTVPAPNQTQPNGQAIPWGTGALVDPSTAVAAPPYLTGGNATTPTGSNSTSAAPSSSMVLSSTSSAASSIVAAGTSTPKLASQSGVSTGTNSASAAAASSTGNTTSSSGSNSGGALILGTVSARAAQAGVALAVIAGTFTFLV